MARSGRGITITRTYTPDPQRSALALIKVLEAGEQHADAAGQEPGSDTFLFTTEAAKLLELHPSSVRQAVARGSLRAGRWGTWLTFRRADLAAYDKQRRARPDWPGHWPETEG